MKKIAFLDRDGVINVEVGHLHRIQDFQFTNRCCEALKTFLDLGFELVIITNQAGIGKGLYTEEQYQKLTHYYLNLLSRKGIYFLDVLHCPHHSDAVDEKFKKECNHRKPNPGMVLKIMDDYDVDVENSILVGDKLTDIYCGKNASLKKLYLVSSGHFIPEGSVNRIPIFNDLYDLSKHLRQLHN